VRILFLAPQFPYPPEQGRDIRNYNLLWQVSRRHEVSLLCFARPRPGDNAHLGAACKSLQQVPLPQRNARDRLRTLALTGDPDMAHRLRTAAFSRALRSLLAAHDYDWVQVEGIELAPYIPEIIAQRRNGRPRIVFDDHNAEYLLQRRAFEADLRRPARWPYAAYSLIQARRLCRYEREICLASDAVVAVSEADAQALRALSPAIHPVVVPNGVDTERYRPGLPDRLPLTHPAIVFTGKMDFRPNIDGVLWFYQEVWPLIRARAPEARFYVVGKNPHPRLAPLSGDPSVVITGYVADILPYFGGADVYVVPLRVGGGTRLKVLEAMAAGLPLVSTRLGAEGIDLSHEMHALLADTPEAFAQAVLRLLNDQDLRERLGRAARAFVETRYSWEQIAPRLETVYTMR